MKKQLIPTLILPPEPTDMTDSVNRRASSPLLGTCLPPPILEDDGEEDEELCEANKSCPPNNLNLPNTAGSHTRDLYSPQLLCVDESKRPRAHSDPSVQVGGFANYILPEITVTVDDGGGDPGHVSGASKGGSHQYLMQPLEASRKRSNTCPEDLFRPSRKGRPATPPPSDVAPVLGGKRRTHSAGGPRRFSFNFAPPPVAMKSPTSVSFAHHKLSKVNEDLGSDSTDLSKPAARADMRERKTSMPEKLQSGKMKDTSQTSSTPCGFLTNNHSCNPDDVQSSLNQHQKDNSDRLTFNCRDSTLSSSTLSNKHIPPAVSSNGTLLSLKNIPEPSSPQQQVHHTTALLDESLRTLSLTERHMCDSVESKTHGSASGLLKDSSTAWRAGDTNENGHWTTV